MLGELQLESYTAGALRALDRATARARAATRFAVDPIDLLAGLLDEPECRAAELLAEFGIDARRVSAELGAATSAPAADESIAGRDLPPSAALKAALTESLRHARAGERNRPIATEHLLAGLLSGADSVSQWLADAGILLDSLEFNLGAAAATTPLELPPEIGTPELTTPADAVDLGRILDAAANRAREGLRVVEDFARFALDDPFLTRRLKDVRHRLTEALRGLDPELLVGSRDTRGDVGTHIMTASEGIRENPRAVLSANFKRLAEALRSIEEYSKLIDVWLAGRFEVLRYDVYTLEKLVLSAVRAQRGFADVRLYVLVGGLPTLGDLTWIAGEALAGGAQAIQLREKGIADRELLRRAREVRILTNQAGARFVLNDRPDLARLAGADAVHIGQQDMTARDARRIIGAQAVIGVSTHDPAQLEQAILDGAGYLGVGPVFASETKEFTAFAGLDFVRQAAETTTLPWFALGGVNEANLDSVLNAGATRIAVSGAVVKAERPKDAARRLRERLDAS